MQVNFTYTYEDYAALTNEQPGHFQLWINKVQAYVVSKRGFGNEAEIEAFKNLVSSKFKNQELIK